MIRAAIIALASLGICGTVNAAAVPQGSNYDTRVQTVNYNPLDVTVIHVAKGIVSRIVLEQGENILAHPTGFDNGYSITARRHILYIKPVTVEGIRPNANEWPTNLLIETDKRPSGYLFDLQLTNANDSAAFYQVQFAYPTEDEIKRLSLEKQQAEEQAEIERQAAASTCTNWLYDMALGKGSDDIRPNMACDNSPDGGDSGFTYLRFPRDVPTVFIVNQDGTESRVNSHMDPLRPDVLVIHKISDRFVLRLNPQAITIHNNGYTN